MTRPYILSLDLGTTGNRAIVFDRNQRVVSSVYEEFPQIYPQPGWVEHDPLVIWESAKKSILKHDRKVLNSRFLGGVTLLVIDPFNTVLDGMGYKQKVKTQLNIAPVGFDAHSSKTVWGVNFSARF